MDFDATHERSRVAAKSAQLFLALTTVILGYAVVFAGGPIALSRGDLRVHGLICVLLAGLLGMLYFLLMKPAPGRKSLVERLVLLVPAYALLQATPLPLGVIRILSPARARLAEAVSPMIPTPKWVSLSVAPTATLYHFLLLAASTILFFVVLDLSGRFSLRLWAVTFPLVLIAAGEAILGLAQVAGHPDAVATGTYVVRDHYAALLAMILPFVALYPFTVLASREPDQRNDIAPALLLCTGIGLSALIMAAILSSLSRVGFVASLAALMFVTIVAAARGRSRRRISLIFAGAALATLIALVFLPSARFVHEDRSPAWSETLSVVAAYPVFGCGVGADNSGLHNDYLQSLAELGIASFLLASAPLSLILARLPAACRQNRAGLRWVSLACAGAVVAIAIHSLVDSNLYVPANLFALAWILGLAAHAGRSASFDASVPIEPAEIILVPPTPVRSRSYP